VTPDGAFNSSQRKDADGRAPALRAFSLVELLVVMAIIVILFTLYWSGGSKSFQTRQMSKCELNLQNIYVALKTYSLDNHDLLPALTNAQTSEPVLSQLIPRDTTSTEFFICPGGSDSPLPEAQPFADRKISYAYYMGHTLNDGGDQALLSDRQVDTNPKVPGQSLFSADGKKPGNNHNKYGGNIMFCDGNVQKSPASSAFNLTNAPGVVLLNPKP
jgi:prepilin-type N-terminal cleavage/methylation domain-containing protein/prepilin-type processing-associated H-X9-DG protein